MAPEAPKRGGTTTILERERATKLGKPPLYKVLLHNDDFTPRDFVVFVLQQVFSLGEGEASMVMMHAHLHGLAVVGLFTFEIAESKVHEAMAIAKEAELPLLFTCEKE